MIDVKLRDLLDSMEVLKELGQKSLSGRTAYQIGKILRQVENEFNLFNEARGKVIDKYCTKDENGKPIINEETNEFTFSEENLKSTIEEVNNLLDSDVSLNANKISLADLESLDFTPTQMALLDVYIEE